jgi:hypothetical protein
VGNSSIIKPLVTSQVKTKQPRHGTILYKVDLVDRKIGFGLQSLKAGSCG